MKQPINEIKRMQQLAGIINESQLNEAEDLLSLIKDYVDYDYTVDQGYGEGVVANAQSEMKRIKDIIISQKGQQYFKLVDEFAELSTYNEEYAGSEESKETAMQMGELADQLGFTIDQLKSM
jgi:hypothetical protein